MWCSILIAAGHIQPDRDHGPRHGSVDLTWNIVSRKIRPCNVKLILDLLLEALEEVGLPAHFGNDKISLEEYEGTSGRTPLPYRVHMLPRHDRVHSLLEGEQEIARCEL